jgi:putative ABC transport system permease protein
VDLVDSAAEMTDILTLFLGGVAGGLVGVGLGAGLAKLISRLSLGGLTITPVVRGDSVMLAMGFALGIGLFFGIYPAHGAASLNPIDALHLG